MSTSSPTAEFFVPNEDEWKLEWEAAKEPLPHAEVREYERAAIIPLRWRENGPDRNFEGGVVSETGAYLAGHLRALDDLDPPFTARTSYDVPPDAVRERDEEVVFGGVLFDHIGHLITDSSARLWYPVSARDARKIVFLRSPEFKNWSSVDWKPLMELAGLDASRIEILEEPTRFRKVVVPQEAYYAHGGFRPEWTSFFDAVRSRVEPGSRKKVYLSRSRFARGNVFNEDLFERYYRELGFYVAYPEELDFRRKAELISGADELVSTIGTTSHLFLFAKPGVRATVLLRTSRVLKMQLYIGAACSESCSYVESFRNRLPSYHADGVYYLAPTPRFRSYLEAHAMPPFGTATADGDDVYAAKRVGPYVEKWLEVFGEAPDTFDASKSPAFRAMGGLAKLAQKLGSSDDRNRLAEGVSVFVQSTLERTAKLEEARAELKATRAELKATRTKLKATRTKLEETRAELKATRMKLKEMRAELKATHTKLKETHAGLKATRAKLKETRAGLKTTRAKLKETKLAMNRMWRRSFRGRIYSLLRLLRIIRPAPPAGQT